MRPNEDVGQAAFIEARPEFNKYAQPGDVILAGPNFGCGSSREYAVLALKRRQISAILAASFARIFFRNAINLGIPLFIVPEVVEDIEDGAQVSIDIPGQQLVAADKTYLLPPLPEFMQQIVDVGGIVPYIKLYGHFPGQS